MRTLTFASQFHALYKVVGVLTHTHKHCNYRPGDKLCDACWCRLSHSALSNAACCLQYSVKRRNPPPTGTQRVWSSTAAISIRFVPKKNLLPPPDPVAEVGLESLAGMRPKFGGTCIPSCMRSWLSNASTRSPPRPSHGRFPRNRGGLEVIASTPGAAFGSTRRMSVCSLGLPPCEMSSLVLVNDAWQHLSR